MIKESLLLKSDKLEDEDGPIREERAPTIKGINNGGETKVFKNSHEGGSFTRKKLEELEKIIDVNEEKTKLAIDINESPEKSFHNSPQSSKKIKLHNSHVQISSILDERENKPEQTKTMISDLNKQEIESFLLDTPSELKGGL